MIEINIYIDGISNKTLIVPDNTKLIDIISKNNKITNISDYILICKGNIISNYELTLKDINISDDTSFYIYSINLPISFVDIFQKLLNQLTGSSSILDTLSLTPSAITSINLTPVVEPFQYNDALTVLHELGFTDDDMNITLLNMYNGDVDLVASLLLNSTD